MRKRIHVFFALLAVCESARIFAIYPVPCFSHQLAFRPLTMDLINRGHQVTVVTPFPIFPDGGAPANLTEISIQKLVQDMTKKALVEDMKDAKDLLTQQKIAFDVGREIFDVLFHELRDFLSSGQKFDLILAEACARMGVLFSHIFKAPVVQISSFGGTFDAFSIVGAPIHPLLYPIANRERFKNLTWLDKIMETYRHYRLIKLYYDGEESENEVARKHLGDVPTLTELADNVEIIFLNVHPIWDSNRPVPPNLIYLGGLHLQKEKALPTDLKSQLDASENAIYLSFGSTITSPVLSEEKIEMFLRVLSKLPYTIFWKWDADVPTVPDNVIVRKWYPQADLLKHPNIKLFITQGGLQSIDEAIDAGVPMVGIPIIWDQWYNVDKIVELEIGVMCNIRSVTEDEFATAIETVINDTRYRRNVEKLRALINDQPQTSLERAVWWIEHVMRHKGAKYLKSPAHNMSVIDYFETK
ncbi:unnamed protein product [Leptosia nina]|uniref:UDP-glucuronosyltransferase n=1 Tax=Leptosia nina TaxID=320188 RepID=A0AAV1JNF0_9NEOP